MKEYKLPKEFATKWVEALRSGEYKQGVSDLKSSLGYCCLGIACKIQGISDKEMFGKAYPKDITQRLHANIPPMLLEGAVTLKLIVTLAKMNDGGTSFPEIADWIEENVEFV